MKIYLIEMLIISAIVLILGACGYEAWRQHSSEKITLIKSDFFCSEYKVERKFRHQVVGAVIMSIPYDDDVCISYKRVAN